MSLFDSSGPYRPGASDDPPPPAREQLPLPRRRRQGHIEPQLREPGGCGTGTPFAAFSTEPPDSAHDADDRPSAGGSERAGTPDPAAAFRAATGRDRWRPSPRPRKPRT